MGKESQNTDLAKLIKSLDGMTSEEREVTYKVLAQVGVNVDKLKGKRAQAKRNKEALIQSLPEEYNLVILVKCQTCGVKEEVFFSMKRDLSQWGLVSVPLTERPTVFRCRKEITETCRNCEGVLMGKTQEELVSLVFTTVNRCQEKIRTLMSINL